jgi:hypothetical protein
MATDGGGDQAEHGKSIAVVSLNQPMIGALTLPPRIPTEKGGRLTSTRLSRSAQAMILW